MSRPLSEAKQKVFDVTEGVLSNVSDLILAQVFFTSELIAKPDYSSRSGWRNFYQSNQRLEVLNHDQLKRAFYRLKQRGLIEFIQEELTVRPVVTEQGRQKLGSIFPSYDQDRSWDNRIYLVTYDVAEENRRSRDILREYLKKIGCGMLQASVWLTPYNPRQVLEEFVADQGLEGAVIISDLGQDGGVGTQSVEELISEVYSLDRLNQRYEQFVGFASTFDQESDQENFDPARVAYAFLSILRDDPQLPFELLPEKWLGDQAYQIYQRVVTPIEI